MVERGEDIERQQTEHLVKEIVLRQIANIRQSLADFEHNMRECNFHNSLKTYMNVEHFLQRGKDAAHDLMNLDPERGTEALKDVEALEQNAYESFETLVKGCECKMQLLKD